jgi:hypothetical protein
MAFRSLKALRVFHVTNPPNRVVLTTLWNGCRTEGFIRTSFRFTLSFG